MGQVDGRPTRQAMLSELEKLSGEHFENHNTSWLAPDMIEQSEYKRIMADSIFIPCPKGNTSVDCFRFCEALEAGSIPIPERGDDYWDKLLGEDHPFYIQANSDWKGIANQLESLLSNTKILDAYNKKVLEWWANHKFKLRDKFSSIISGKNISPIPKVINQTWEHKNLTPGIKKYIDKLKSLNPDFEYKLHDKLDRESFIKENFDDQVLESYSRLEAPAFKADLWRLCYLYKFGGVYIDIDMSCINSFENLFDNFDFIAPIDCDGWGNESHQISNAFIASAPNHPILKNCIDLIAANVAGEKWNNSEYVLNLCGPGALGKSINQFLGKDLYSSFSNKHGKHSIPGHDIKLIYFEDQFFKDTNGRIIIQNSHGDENLIKAYKELSSESNSKKWIDYHTNPISEKKSLDIDQFNNKRKEFNKLSIYNKTEPRDNMWEILIDDERIGKHRKPYDWLSYACSLIPEQKIPEEKFYTFNPGNKIAIVSLHTPEISDFGIYSERSIQEYCEHQGYTFHIYRDKLDESFSPNWSKAQILLNHIDDHDYVIWMDSDTLVVDPSKTFEDIIKESNKDILACSDIGGNSKINSGVVIFKSSDYSKNILNNWHNFEGDKSDLYASGGDQEILVYTISNADPDFNNVEIFPMDKFNTDPRFATEDSFILHFMAYPHTFKKFFMSYWHK